jgi:mannitol/fructose-specific phosphotransferase system IIA component (Ntr-type)
MKSLLTALQEGRLVELPDVDKQKALEYLALLIEAVPDIGTGLDVVGKVREREASANTGLGCGVACPHVRVAGEGELLCAVGWAPRGIAYGAPDGRPVHLLIMYYIPDSQRGTYLKEVSGLAKAIMSSGGIALAENADIHAVRNQLLDWVGLAIDAAVPHPNARLIKLEQKSAAAGALGAGPARAVNVIPFALLVCRGKPPLVLAQNAELVSALESRPEVGELISRSAGFELAGYQIALRSAASYAGERTLHDCIAIRIPVAAT